MKSVSILSLATKNYVAKKLELDALYRKDANSEKIEKYSEEIKRQVLQTLEQKRAEGLRVIKKDYRKTKESVHEFAKEFLQEIFTKGISPENAATLDNLSKIVISEAEMEMYISKFSGNPMALRRLGEIAKEKGFSHLQVSNNNALGYEYYVDKYVEFEEHCESVITECDEFDFKKPVDLGMEIVLGIMHTGLEKQEVKSNQEFSILEDE